MVSRQVLIVLVISLMPAVSSATTWNVYEDGSGDAPFIQAAIDSAASRDTVRVWPGTYDEDPILIYGKSLQLESTGGAEMTTIPSLYWIYGNGPETVIVSGFRIVEVNGQPAFRVALINRFEIRQCIIEGFGDNSSVAGVEEFSIDECVFRDNINQHDQAGGALAIESVHRGDITNCLFIGNQTTHWNEGGNPDLGGGGALNAWTASGYGPLRISGNLFVGNEAPRTGAVMIAGNIEFFNNTVVGNTSDLAAVYLAPDDEATIHHNVFASNDPYGLYVWLHTGWQRCCCNGYWENTGWPDFYNHEGQWAGPCLGCEDIDDWADVMMDPLFCDPDLEDYHLQNSSPLLPENHPPGSEDCGGLIGAFGAGCASSSVSEPAKPIPSSWGQIKATYK
ncbi:MAG: DUF1565 domain-containing protein [Candidatus Eisenbacteria bacterium]|uniref:DUF1565 domain-containing protein n=1 Tax=Eiseniibacteriota bacterium TaxID=2212470 RepID=A0A948S1F7_UNCEI|nr:DUF1565 domain-containing protein [Candidatus Eisenbacteria bacterium]MBU1947980.1 DUF1565 domain-containing protein [Candidatus Eisenbacteria bacterium]MBU2693434.1 DUF1565 domain-containing protein [Candidatus Eisenbacteria bacterium]